MSDISVNFETVDNEIEPTVVYTTVDFSSEAVAVDLSSESQISVLFEEVNPTIEFEGGGAITPSYDRESDYDSVNLNYLYTGKAAPGSATSAAVWRISRFNMATGLISYADGNENFDYIYDNRESLSYS